MRTTLESADPKATAESPQSWNRRTAPGSAAGTGPHPLEGHDTPAQVVNASGTRTLDIPLALSGWVVRIAALAEELTRSTQGHTNP